MKHLFLIIYLQIKLCYANSYLTVSEEQDHKTIGKDGLKKVKDWYVAPKGLNLSLICQVETFITSSGNSVNNAPKITASFAWSLHQHTKSTDRKIDAIQDLNNTFDSECTFTQKYDLRSRKIQNGLNVACSEKFLLHQVSKGIDDGTYICNATLEIDGSNFETFQGEVEVRIGRETSYTTFIVAGILVSILVIFLLTGLCFKISGQRMKWQMTEAPQTEDGPFHSQNSWGRYTRNSSMSSGIVFNAHPASMANLIKKLETVDDSNLQADSEAPAEAIRPAPKSTLHEDIYTDKKDENQTMKSRHLAFMKFISEMYEKKQKRPRNSRISRRKTLSGPKIKLDLRKAQVTNTNTRRLSLGVLPGSIGIGAGVMMDYSTPSSASISTATRRHSLRDEHRSSGVGQGARRHPRIRSLTGDTRRSSTPTLGTIRKISECTE